MAEILLTGSILAAFFAGAVALFSPCCIVFLLPAYLATAVKSRRWRLLPITFVFGLGLATVLVPVTLGIGLVSTAVSTFHAPLYVGGGVLMLGLAALALVGRSWSLPSFVRAPDARRSDAQGVFALGVFSGVASSCCAPVLAGVMVLSALSSSVTGSLLLGLAYVFGMTVPLFVLAAVWDRFRLGERALPTAKPLTLRIGGRSAETNTLNAAVAGAFAVMGVAVITLALTGSTTTAPGAQLAIGRWLSAGLARATTVLEPVPEPILGLALLGLAGAFVAMSVRGRRRSTSSEGGSCHEPVDDEATPDGQATPEGPKPAASGRVAPRGAGEETPTR